MFSEIDKIVKEFYDKTDDIIVKDDKLKGGFRGGHIEEVALRAKLDKKYRSNFKIIFPDATEEDIDDMMIGCQIALDMTMLIYTDMREKGLLISNVKVVKVDTDNICIIDEIQYGSKGGSDEKKNT